MACSEQHEGHPYSQLFVQDQEKSPLLHLWFLCNDKHNDKQPSPCTNGSFVGMTSWTSSHSVWQVCQLRLSCQVQCCSAMRPTGLGPQSAAAAVCCLGNKWLHRGLTQRCFQTFILLRLRISPPMLFCKQILLNQTLILFITKQ